MADKLSNLDDNLSEIYKKECNARMERKKIKSECDFIGFKDNKLHYKCKECGKRCFKSINRSDKNFPIMNQFCNSDINKFVLLLRKGVYLYEYMNSWERLDETSILNKKDFHS